MKPGSVSLSSRFAIVTGRPARDSRGFLILRTELLEDEHSILALLEGADVLGVPVPAACVGCQELGSMVLFLCEDGQLWVYRDGDFELAHVLEGVESPLRDMGLGGAGNPIAVGTLNQVYTFHQLADWRREVLRAVDGGTVQSAASGLFGLESTDSFRGEESYAVGWGGACFVKEAELWRPLALPTNLDLYRIMCAADGYAYACGAEGVVLKGRGDRWAVIENELTDEPLWGLAFFKGRAFVSSMYDIYEIESDHLMPFDYGETGPRPPAFYRLSASEDVMWSIAERYLFQFDGRSWTQLLALE